MSLDPRFILAYPFTDYFPDKDTGLPLANGIVTFYRDSARTELKNIYTLRGAPPYSTASYVPLPNPMTLSSIGTPQDNDGNNVDIYFFPYEGNPDDDSVELDLYYITCTSSALVPQFTRSGIPQISDEGTLAGENIENYIPNPQFVTHNSGESSGSASDGEIQQAVTNIAPGNWYFERPAGSAATDYVSFYRFGSPITPPPTGNPGYAVEIENTAAAPGDAFKYLMVRFPNVNKFASADQVYTFWFEAVSLAALPAAATVRVIKYFGSGGSATQTINKGNIEIPISYGTISVPINFGLNSGATIGPNKDDYVAIAINLPVGAVFRVRLTNFIVTPGDVQLTEFPITTNAKSLAVSLAGASVPDYEGYDLGLPVRNGRNGYEADHSVVGKIYPVAYDTTQFDWAEKLCDGQGLVTSEYTNEGIPLARLQEKLFNSAGFPMYGTAPAFVVSSLTSQTGEFSICTNLPGAQTAAADGDSGFTFTTVGTGSALYGVTGYHTWQSSSPIATIVNNAVGLVDYAVDVDTSAVIKQIRDEAAAYGIFTINTTTIVLTGGGKKFTYQTPTTDYYVWFKVGGVGSDPGGTGTGILINLPAVNSVADISIAISAVLSGYTYSIIKVVTPPTAGKYFTFSASGQQYYCYYILNGVGADPAIPGAIAIPVNLGATPTAAQTADATKLAINGYSYALPDMRGMVPRGLDSTGIWDVDYATRLTKIPSGTNNSIGSIELDSILHHEHATITGVIGGPPFTDYGFSGGGQFASDIDTTKYVTPSTMLTVAPDPMQLHTLATIDNLLNNQGETRGINMAFNWVIKL